MVEGLIALLLFSLFLLEWPRFIRELQATADQNPDPLTAKIRMERLRDGEQPWPDDDDGDEDDKYL